MSPRTATGASRDPNLGTGVLVATSIPPIASRSKVALDMLVAKLKEDRHVLAAILFGSLVRGEAWEKSNIDLVAVLRDGVEREGRGYWLLENGVSIWVETIPRSQLKQQFERALPGTIRHAMRSQARLLFSHDESIAELFLICDWLAEEGILEKMAAPLRLTRKSQMTVEEVAFYYDTQRRTT